MNERDHEDISHRYIVEDVPERLKANLWRVIPARKPVVTPLPNMPLWTCLDIAYTMFERFGYDEYIGCVSAETKSRLIPYASPKKDVEGVLRIFEKHYPMILEAQMRWIKPKIQTFNTESRLGDPVNDFPENRLDIILFHIHEALKEPLAYESCVTTQNIRKQEQPKSKVRKNQAFLGSDLKPYSKTTTYVDHQIKIGDAIYLASRCRPVNALPPPNLGTQILDSLLHDWYMQFPAFHHDPGHMIIESDDNRIRAIDVSHYERFMPLNLEFSRQMIGGRYNDIAAVLSELGVLVPSDDWSKAAVLKPAEGYLFPFASGQSAVSRLGKDTALTQLIEFCIIEFGLNASNAMTYVCNGGDSRFRVYNYGDDMLFTGEPSILLRCQEFLAQTLNVQEEIPKKFLGRIVVGGRLLIPNASYVVKGYLPERRPYSVFRKYPYFAWKEKRAVYSREGEATFGDVVNFEDAMLRDKAPYQWDAVLDRAKIEETKIGQRIPQEAILGKDYLLTDKQKLETGDYIGLGAAECKPILDELIGKQWRKHLSYI